ncbi:MAG: outer membrane protein assembly factor BamA [Spirochaetales bacterium]|nr:outer membrane protein assembly factor BamA [Spirochaetales bacterium]
MRNIVLLLWLILIPFASILAQATDSDDTEWYLNKPIEEIRFKGLENVAAADLEGITAGFIGKAFTTPLFWDLQSKLFALDYFEEFVPEAIPADDAKTKVIIEFSVTERPVIDAIDLMGNRSVRRNDILDAIVLKIDDMVNSAKLRVDIEAIKNLYLERGYPNVDVDGRIEKTEGSNATVTFTIDEGSQTKVKTIQFSGNSFASESTLRRIMKTKEQSLFTSGVYQESKVAEDIEIIQGYYWDRGYIDTEVIDVVRDIQEGEDGKTDLILTVYIEEGNQYTYGGMEFEGNELYSDERLQELLRQVPGKILSKTKLEADFQRVNEIYSSDGYIYNMINREEIRNEETREISFKISIIERGRAHIENIIVTGNEKTKDHVIFRELPFEEGDIFSARKFVEGHQNLLNTQYFSSIIPDVRQGSVEGLVDVIFNLEEGRTTNIEFGITFAGANTGFPIIGILAWNDSNFLGRGQNFRIGTEISGNTQNLNFSFTESWLLGQRWSGGIDLKLDHSLAEGVYQDVLTPIFSNEDENQVPDPYDGHYVSSDSGEPYNEDSAGDKVTDYAYAISQGETIGSAYLMDYDSYNVTLGASTGYTFVTPAGRIGLATRIDTALSYVDYDNTINRPYDEAIRENYQALKPITKWLLNVTFDTRDLIYSPTKGMYAKQSGTFTGGILPSTRDYIQTGSKLQGFFTLFDVPVFENWNLKGVLALNTSISFIFPQIGGENTTSQDLLYIDGMTMAKGWPRIYNGRTLWDNWIELRMPIVEQYVWWDWYFSGTALWAELSDFAAMAIDDFLFGFGGGARLTIPGFPIGLYFTKRFRVQNGAVDWQMGTLLPIEGRDGSGIDFVISFTADLF